MADKMERFTQRARRVFTLAQEEAERLKHTYVGTEHLLLGLMREDGGVAGRVLRDLGADLRKIEQLVEQLMPPGQRQPNERLDLSPGMRSVLVQAVEEARRMGHHYVGTEHLLLGLVRQEEGVAIEVLRRLGIKPEEVRRHTRRILQESPPPPPSKPAPPQPQSSMASPSPSQRRQSVKTPLVDQLATDLTALAEEGKLDPVIGRDVEIERVIQILSRRTKNNPALIGEPGVGKTAIVEGLAQRIVNRETPATLLDKRVLQLDVGSLVAGTMYRGQFEERLKRVIEELKSSDSILFIDEVHMLVGAGSAGSSVDAANILKPALARGELQCIGATTFDEYRKHIESDAALARRFQPIFVDEPTIEETIEILHGIKAAYEAHHNLEITQEAIEAAAHLSARYVPDRFLPDKAIDLIDEGASRVRMYKSPESIRVRRAEADLADINEQLEENAYLDEERRAELYARATELSTQLANIKASWNPETNKPRLTAEDIAEVVSMWTGIPVTSISADESERLLHMEEFLHKRIVGQHEAIEAIAKAVRRARAGLKDPRRPIGSFIFLGPTGVGKTELTKALAEFMFGSEDALIQLDMSEFMERHTVARLVGAPPGYVGYEDAGQLTEALRRRPYSIVVFDEIEKAHPEAFNMLLQIMEEGRLSDARGRKVDFRNAIIVMTSNIGAEVIKRGNTLGFDMPRDETVDQARDYEEMRKKVMEQLRRAFRPEFLNRVSATIVFRSLTREELMQIVDLEINKVRERLSDHALTLEITDAAKALLGEKGYDPEYGARPLRRVITNMVEDRLSDGILAGTFKVGSTILIDVADGELVMKTVESPNGVDHGALTDYPSSALIEGTVDIASPESN
ncbi:MAG: NDP-hexose 4-ketoreductase [Candidatus Thermofonsia Clade 1 bacterium]|uniref:NDP-hexose 4-ketoreductase n=1 Tax=Candidatus Thermofonsia Clade 1 bacterium TaxID=2364210 RepID=A0A2M8PHY1_9CHLR|nr:MAG: NDP-hexose 4-ketoreductase [Candidatus Thermofonsia Clade 1 bacterium]RMF54072.1 MAG: ATP-dependent Clp protease ATP-binding subunit [Chloroflexota bacterium]